MNMLVCGFFKGLCTKKAVRKLRFCFPHFEDVNLGLSKYELGIIFFSLFFIVMNCLKTCFSHGSIFPLCKKKNSFFSNIVFSNLQSERKKK